MPFPRSLYRHNRGDGDEVADCMADHPCNDGDVMKITVSVIVLVKDLSVDVISRNV